MAAQAVSRLQAYYPGVPPADEHVTALSILLASYSADVIGRVADPVSGIAVECKFFPSLAELKIWCDRLSTPDEYQQRAADRAARLEQARAALPPPVDHSKRPTMAELKAKYGENWGLGGAPGSRFSNRAPPGTPEGSVIDWRGRIVGQRNADGTYTYFEPPPEPRQNPRPEPMRPYDPSARALYERNAAAYIKRLPETDRKRLPILRAGTPAFAAWQRYFYHINHVPIEFWKIMRGDLGKSQGYTAPAAFPGDFDLTYND